MVDRVALDCSLSLKTHAPGITAIRNGEDQPRNEILLIFGKFVRKIHTVTTEPERRGSLEAAIERTALLHCADLRSPEVRRESATNDDFGEVKQRLQLIT